MMFVDEVASADNVSTHDFVDFLEALARMCEMKTIPLDEEFERFIYHHSFIYLRTYI